MRLMQKRLILGIGGVAAANQILPQITIDAGGAAECDSLIRSKLEAETLQANASGTGLTITASGLDQS
jgi:hypothetical protein